MLRRITLSQVIVGLLLVVGIAGRKAKFPRDTVRFEFQAEGQARVVPDQATKATSAMESKARMTRAEWNKDSVSRRDTPCTLKSALLQTTTNNNGTSAKFSLLLFEDPTKAMKAHTYGCS
jgi:hypothetical protein